MFNTHIFFSTDANLFIEYAFNSDFLRKKFVGYNIQTYSRHNEVQIF